jgi:hypothetical protein
MSVGNVMSSNVVFESDWLGSCPCFYHGDQGIWGTSMPEVVRKSGASELDGNGLYNFLDFGFSVLEETPVRGIRSLRHSSRLVRDDDGRVTPHYLGDPIERWSEERLSESDVIELIRSRVRAWEDGLPAECEVILPLSGGLDSRLLAWCIRDRSRVRAFTYGIAANQEKSFEAVRARLVAQRLKLRWERVPLGGFHEHLGWWDQLYGLSTHAHGMYHLEFYSHIKERVPGPAVLLSGIIGDAWAGSVEVPPVGRAVDLLSLGYTHGMRANPQALLLPVTGSARDDFLAAYGEALKSPRFRLVTAMRFKIVLLSYLLRLPREFGWPSWSPFLDIDVAKAMVYLPSERRRGRRWLLDFFAREGLDVDDVSKEERGENVLNWQGLRQVPVPPLDVDLLGRIIDAQYIRWINGNARANGVNIAKRWLLSVPKLRGVARMVGVSDNTLKAYCAYLCLYPIERFLRQGDHPVTEHPAPGNDRL